MSYEPHRIGAADIESLRKHYTDLQILEMIVSVAGNIDPADKDRVSAAITRLFGARKGNRWSGDRKELILEESRDEVRLTVREWGLAPTVHAGCLGIPSFP